MSEEEATRREGAGRPDKPAYLTRGTLVGRYVVLDRLGEGGMGVVYTAFDPELDRKVAIKLLQTGDHALLLREAQALARLSHPNVVAVHDVGTLAGQGVFVAMELVDGDTLRAWLRDKPRSWRDVLPILVAAGQGLAAAHAAGLVHRDFKPENVLVGTDGRTRVMDFGLARAAGEQPASRSSDLSIESKSPLSQDLTADGTVAGTPAYMAPELYGGHGAEARSDQFAFGVALFEALFRARPYERADLQPGAPPREPRIPAGSEVPARLRKVAMRAISLDPAARYPSMDALLHELDARPAPSFAFVAVGVAIAALVVSGVLMIRTSHDDSCTEHRLTGVWDDGVRARVDKAFAASDRPFAAGSLAGVERALDAYASAWTDASLDTCRSEQTEHVRTLRASCLDQRLDELGALAHRFSEADAPLVEKGDKAVFALEPIARCSDIAALLAPGSPPPEHAADIDRARKQLAAAKADTIAQRYPAALTAAKEVADAAAAMHYDPLAADALIVRGTALLGSGKIPDSAAAFSDAAQAAIRSGDLELAARASLQAALVSADQLGKPSEGKIWLDIGEAAIARVGAARELDPQRYKAQGIVAVRSGDLVAGVAAHDKMLAAAEAAYGHDAPAMWDAEQALAATLTKAYDYDRALQHYRRALALREASVGPNHPDVALVLSNLGVSYRHVGAVDKARAALERALAIRERLYGPKDPRLIATLDNFASLDKQTGDLAGALALIERAKAIAVDKPGTAHPSYHQIASDHADILVALGKLDDARAEYDEVLALEDKTHSAVLPATLTMRAELALADSNWADAAAFATRAIALFEAAGGVDNPELWRPLTALARARRSLGEDVHELAERAIAIGTKAHVPASDLAPARQSLVKNP